MAAQASSDLEFVESTYAQVLGRAVDPQGLHDYLVQLRQGVPRAQVLQALRDSDEAGRHMGHRTPTPVDMEGHDLHVSAQELGAASQLSLTQLLQAPDDSFVHLAYLRILGRPPDAEGRAAYTAQMRAGISRQRILQRLQQSSEAKDLQRAGRQGLQLPKGACLSSAVSMFRRARRWLRTLRSHGQPGS